MACPTRAGSFTFFSSNLSGYEPLASSIPLERNALMPWQQPCRFLGSVFGLLIGIGAND